MADNLYLELELFLDPPVTEPAELEAFLNEQIKQWNKQVNANPKLKLRVNTAKKFINSGLRNLNLSTLANEARELKLGYLHRQIEIYKKTGAVTEKNLKQLKDRFKKFFTEQTIETEAGGVDSASTVKAPRFNVPKQPYSLQADKIVSVADMKQIAEWLTNVRGGKLKNLYQLLDMPQTAQMAALKQKAEDEASRINKMPKSGVEADVLNRLAQKFLLYFKNDAERKSYDAALRREPFDELCDDEFSLYAENFFDLQKTDWQLYTDTIQQTYQLGFTQEEAEWLVYEYFCIKKKCPEPIPDFNKSAAVPVTNVPVTDFWIKVKDIAVKVKDAVGNIADRVQEQIGNYKPPEQTVVQKTEIYGPEPSQPPVPPSFPNYTSKEFQTLINEKKFNRIYDMLVPYQSALPDKYTKLWGQVKDRINQCDKQKQKIQETILQGNFGFAERQIAQLQQYVPDYSGIETLRSEIKNLNYTATKTEVEIRNLMEQRKYIDAEIQLRWFLHANPNCKFYGLLTVIQQIEDGIVQVKASRSMSFICMILFAVIWYVLAYGFQFGGWGWNTGSITWIEEFIYNNNKELKPEDIETIIEGLEWIGFISAGFAFLSAFFYGKQILSILPAIVRKKICCQRLWESDFAKAKLSRTVWYGMLTREWQQQHTVSQSPQSPVRQPPPMPPRPVSPPPPVHPKDRTENVRPVPVSKPQGTMPVPHKK